MNPFISKVLVDVARKRLEKKNNGKKPINKRQVVTQVRSLEVELTHTIKEYVFIAIGVLSAGFGLKGFLLPNHFIDGGATGISLLLENITNLNLSILLVLVNLPFILLASKTINRKFAIRSIVAIALLALVVHYIDYPIVTQDKLLIAVFWWFFLRFRHWYVYARW